MREISVHRHLENKFVLSLLLLSPIFRHFPYGTVVQRSFED